jgi:DNA-binding NtrC family response regulator
MNIQDIKQRFEIIGNSPLLNYALETSVKVAPTDITVLINGESGVGKEAFSKIIHTLSGRKHGPFIAVNCGAIPEGTIDSELFGHEKGSFTGAHDTRKGYFETVSGGTIFLDEVGELPLETQARLLRVLESGEFIKVGSSKVQKTDVRIVAATNKDLLDLASVGKFREDLYYRLSTVPIRVPALRERKEDIHLLFRKFSADFAEKYRAKPIVLEPDAQQMLINFRWPGNIRQLKNITEQLSVLDEDKVVTTQELIRVLPPEKSGPPMLMSMAQSEQQLSEREIFYKVLFDLRKDVMELKGIVFDMLQGNVNNASSLQQSTDRLSQLMSGERFEHTHAVPSAITTPGSKDHIIEIQLIKKALQKYNGRRKKAAAELGISERTLYRKIKQYDME